MADESLETPTPTKENGSSNPLPLIAKVAEVVLAIFIIGLIVDPMNSFHGLVNVPKLKLDDAAVIYVSVASYLIINMMFLISRALGDRVPKRTIIMFSALGAILHVVAGSLMVHNWRRRMNIFLDFQNNNTHTSKQYNDMLISAAVFTFLNSAVFVVEIILTMRYSS